MQIKCPHCSGPIKVVAETPLSDYTCPMCGSHLNVYDGDTLTYDLPGARLDQFELLDVLGSGRFGTVWRARDMVLQRLVAIKIPRSEPKSKIERQLFLREALAAAPLKHPNIVPILEVTQSDTRSFLVNELVDGPNLQEWLSVHTPTPREAAELCAKLANALQHAHTQGVIHRDLKPGNVLMDAAGEPHLTDFGLAKQDIAGEITITLRGQVLGTPAYMSPEQARGDGHMADGRSDVYSLGVMLYEMLAHRRPFQSKSRLLLHQVVHDEPPFPRSFDKKIPRDLETICLKAMTKDPARRYQTAEAMAKDLQCYLDQLPISARPISTGERTWRWIKRNSRLAAMTTAFVVASLGLGAVAGAMMLTPEAGPPRRPVSITTTPEGAWVVFIPLDERTGEPRPERASPRQKTPAQVNLRPGDYLVEAFLDDQRFHEVLRHVPRQGDQGLAGEYPHIQWTLDKGTGKLTLPPVKIPAANVSAAMARVPRYEAIPIGKPATKTMNIAPIHNRTVPAFLIQPREVTAGDIREVIKKFPVWQNSLNQADSEQVAVGVTYDQAVFYAEATGRRLLNEFEYEAAATAGKTRRFPWGDDERLITAWPIGTAGEPAYDRIDEYGKPVFGLYSNAPEWTSSWLTPYPTSEVSPDMMPSATYRIVRGGPSEAAFPADRDDSKAWRYGPAYRFGLNMFDTTQVKNIGLRCARSPKPRLTAEDFGGVVP